MSDIAPRVFLHTQNEDGDYESICPDCLEIVAAEVLESNLQAAEATHVCNLDTISRLWGGKRFFRSDAGGSD